MNIITLKKCQNIIVLFFLIYIYSLLINNNIKIHNFSFQCSCFIYFYFPVYIKMLDV